MKKTQNAYTNKFTGNELNTYTPSAFTEVRKMMGLKPLIKKTSDKSKLNQQVKNFQDRYICPFCKTPQKWIPNTNLMVCQNPSCSGKPVTDKNGNFIKYAPVYAMLNQRGEAIADTLLNK